MEIDKEFAVTIM